MWILWTRNITDIYWTFSIKRLAGGLMHRCIKSLFKKPFQTLKRSPSLLKLPIRRNKGPWHTCLSPVGRVTSGDWVFRPLTITPSSCRVWRKVLLRLEPWFFMVNIVGQQVRVSISKLSSLRYPWHSLWGWRSNPLVFRVFLHLYLF